MSKNPASVESRQRTITSTIHTWAPPDIGTLRQKLLKLALNEIHSTEFLAQSLQLISDALATPVLFVDEREAIGHSQRESFLVSAQNKAIGTLLVDRNVIQQFDLRRADIQEVADIVGISLLSLQQNEELAALETESEEMLQYAPDVIFVLDESGCIKMANQKAQELMGVREEALKSVYIGEFIDSLTVDELLARGKSGDKFEVELMGTQGRRLASFSISLVTQETSDMQLLMVGRDITMERQAELALRRSERATLMAQTIDYLLHEVNNPLGALMSGISTGLRKNNRLTKLCERQGPGVADDSAESPQDEIGNTLLQQQQILQSALKSGTRINDAMKVLRLANHKRTFGDPKSVDPTFELGLAISALEQEHRNIQIVKSLDPLPLLTAPTLHLSEIFGALLKNAAEAVEAANKDPQRILVTGGRKGDNVLFTIEDNGPGIAMAHREKVFMPFFTTKPLGHSIGLGLSMAMDMVKRVHGTIELTTSEKLGGACVNIYIPMR